MATLITSEEQVDGFLPTMGYKMRVAAKGSDRGVDIFISPDGLGLQEPRLLAEARPQTFGTHLGTHFGTHLT